MVERVASAIAQAGDHGSTTIQARFQRLALAALEPLAWPTEALVDSAHAAVEFDDYWAINSRSDFRQAVRAMVRAAMDRK